MTIALLLAFALAVSAGSVPELATPAYLAGGFALLMSIFIFVFLKWTEPILSALKRLFSFLPGRLGAALAFHADSAATGLKVLTSRRLVLTVMVISIVQWAVMGFGIFLSLLAVRISAPAVASLVVLAFTFVGVTLPSSPGAFGTIQLSFALGLTQYGVETGDAVAASIFWHVLAYSFVTVLGVYYFVRMGYSLTDVSRRARGSQHAEVDPD